MSLKSDYDDAVKALATSVSNKVAADDARDAAISTWAANQIPTNLSAMQSAISAAITANDAYGSAMANYLAAEKAYLDSL